MVYEGDVCLNKLDKLKYGSTLLICYVLIPVYHNIMILLNHKDYVHGRICWK